MEIKIVGLSSSYEMEHLARLFIPQLPVRQTKSSKGELVYVATNNKYLWVALRVNGKLIIDKQKVDCTNQKEQQKQLSSMLYEQLQKYTGIQPPWGMLTGVRPIRLFRRMQALYGEDKANQIFTNTYHVQPDKWKLTQSIIQKQKPILSLSKQNSYSLYISIPFCPTRCSYCSFVSRTIQQEMNLVDSYLQKLALEMEYTAKQAEICGLKLETIYIGGGTPTAISAPQLQFLLQSVEKYFDTKHVLEYTVEAGRPDCTDFEKLSLIKQYGATRVSINPQTFSDAVLKEIGRLHTVKELIDCYETARKIGFDSINMDLIAGLPTESEESFEYSVGQAIALKPENITVHTLTNKRASNLVIDNNPVYAHPGNMLEKAYRQLFEHGYNPYYLYRQKKTLDNLENTGWSLAGKESFYNIYIMEETHTILALGAGASTKLVKNNESCIKRIFNYKYPADYIKQFNQVLQKKEEVYCFYDRNLDT